MAKKSTDVDDSKHFYAITTSDSYPLLHLHDSSSALHGCTVVSKIGLVCSYHQIPENLAYIPQTAVITPYCVFEFLSMPFGLRNSPSTFQRFIDKVVRGMDFLFDCVDDPIIMILLNIIINAYLSSSSVSGCTISKCVFGTTYRLWRYLDSVDEMKVIGKLSPTHLIEMVTPFPRVN